MMSQDGIASRPTVGQVIAFSSTKLHAAAKAAATAGCRPTGPCRARFWLRTRRRRRHFRGSGGGSGRGGGGGSCCGSSRCGNGAAGLSHM